jgi:hypothetical protein
MNEKKIKIFSFLLNEELRLQATTQLYLFQITQIKLNIVIQSVIWVSAYYLTPLEQFFSCIKYMSIGLDQNA